MDSDSHNEGWRQNLAIIKIFCVTMNILALNFEFWRKRTFLKYCFYDVC